MAGSKVKRAIDTTIARDLNIPLTTVRSITQAFIHLFNRELAKKGDVILDGLGRFHIRIQEGTVCDLRTWSDRSIRVAVPYKARVYFAKGRQLKSLIDERYKDERKRRERRNEQARSRRGRKPRGS